MEKILIIDDDINLCTILAEELKEVGYESNFLTGGENVSEYIKTNRVDLVLLDLKMPGKDGFQVLREIENGKNSNPKVIVLTAYADVKSAIDAAKLGATDFISKPYDFDELLITIRKVLQREN
ncbi:MAG: response regulator [Ignavibacteria bacterium]|nr:response regulator [Ignavibacteria bacterium]